MPLKLRNEVFMVLEPFVGVYYVDISFLYSLVSVSCGCFIGVFDRKFINSFASIVLPLYYSIEYSPEII